MRRRGGLFIWLVILDAALIGGWAVESLCGPYHERSWLSDTLNMSGHWARRRWCYVEVPPAGATGQNALGRIVQSSADLDPVAISEHRAYILERNAGSASGAAAVTHLSVGPFLLRYENATWMTPDVPLYDRTTWVPDPTMDLAGVANVIDHSQEWRSRWISPHVIDFLRSGKPQGGIVWIWQGVIASVAFWIALPLGIVLVVWRQIELARARAEDGRVRAGLCAHCGYELSGLGKIPMCPECGKMR